MKTTLKRKRLLKKSANKAQKYTLHIFTYYSYLYKIWEIFWGEK